MIRPQHLIAVALALAALVWPVRPAKGQTTQPTEPTVHPRVQQVRDWADEFQYLHNENVSLAETLVARDLQIRDLMGRLDLLPITFREGTPLEAGGRYVADGYAGTVRIDKRGVVFGGKGAVGFVVKPGGEDFTAYNFYVDHGPRPDVRGKIGVPDFVHTEAAGTAILYCTGGTLDGFAQIGPGAKGTKIIGCKTGNDLRGTGVGMWGTEDVLVAFCEFPNSHTENLIRASPDRGNVSRRIVIAHNKLGNPGNKSVIDVRRVTGARVTDNELTTDEWGTAIGIGRSDDGPGATNITITGNRLLTGGRIHVHQANGLVIEDNSFEGWKTQGVNVALYLGQVTDARLRRNTGPKPAPGVDDRGRVLDKPLIGISSAAVGVNVDASNGWTLPTPVTTPAAVN
jgi:hypothetical protein